MKQQNALLAIIVAAVTVAAVVAGGVLASRQVPRAEAVADAVPLPALATTPRPTTPPVPPPATGTPPAAPSTTPRPPSTAPSVPSSVPVATPGKTATSTGPTKITLAVDKLVRGRLPQIPYLVGREVRGGAGAPLRIPGTADILEIARVNGAVLALTTDVNGSRVLRLGGDDPKSVPNVNRMKINEEQTGAAYAASGPSGSPVEGGTLYADSGDQLRSLKVTTGWNFQVLAYVKGKVYFQSASHLGTGGTTSTYQWTPGAAEAESVPTVPRLTTLSADAEVAATMVLLNDAGSCSAITEVATGKRLWKTCDYYLNGFTPDGATTFGVQSGDEGYCSLSQVALDAKTGRLIREWKGCFQQVTAEDDEHLLMVAVAAGGGGDDADLAIIRCAISTGDCELAVPVSPKTRLRLAK
ncbi:hypothetical protein [Kribbella sp. CA-293567]|uniref:hypothetical protein n=1 Tax=Kribbella sp. CA-293567 TaxID=3002436 RepID=UPI0022DE6EBB|nr:hypothetical protein [Kribbella sp. CA-293567]WBQ04861.1 hypothetical protein OX958_33515 [Kribbella sp. CA-293567]